MCGYTRHGGKWDYERVDNLVSISPVVETIPMDKREIMKTIYECMLVDGTNTKESVRISEFRINCGSKRKGCLRG